MLELGFDLGIVLEKAFEFESKLIKNQIKISGEIKPFFLQSWPVDCTVLFLQL